MADYDIHEELNQVRKEKNELQNKLFVAMVINKLEPVKDRKIGDLTVHEVLDMALSFIKEIKEAGL
jgi:hypothetical protein